MGDCDESENITLPGDSTRGSGTIRLLASCGRRSRCLRWLQGQRGWVWCAESDYKGKESRGSEEVAG